MARIVGLALAALAILLAGPSLTAQDLEVGTLEELKAEREQAGREAALAASEIDVYAATVEELTAALDELEAFVNLQRARLEDAEAAHDSALAAVDRAEQQRVDALTEADLLRTHISDMAVSSFTGESGSSSDGVTELLLSDDPGETARLEHLLEQQTGNLGDSIDRLRLLEIEAQELVGERNAAASRAQQSLAAVEERAGELEAALERQALVVASAELRLEAQLAEAAFLEERDLELADAIRDEQTAINQRIASAARAQGIEIPPPVDLNDIVLLSFYRPGEVSEPMVDPETGEEVPGVAALDVEPFFQIEVNRAIEEQTRQLYELAFSQGIDLGGWGYRPIQRQVELRAAHCGGSDYDIWLRSAFECSPPTARPGFSKHEQGRAIDFQWNGGGIRSQNSEAFRWLAANAPQFGFVNLPSEPWHWSIDEGAERLPD